MNIQLSKHLLSFLLAILMILVIMTSCKTESNNDQTEITSGEITESNSETEYPPLSPDELFDNSKKYMCGDASYFNIAYKKERNDYLSLLSYYTKGGYDIYSEYTEGNAEYITFVKDKELAHIGYFNKKNNITLVTSSTAGEKLPKAVTDESIDLKSVTQIKSTYNNGMGYIITLTDSSFIIIDGGYEKCADELYNQLVKLSDNKPIVIRGWILTHSHADHYPCFAKFAGTYGKKVKLERLMLGLPYYKDSINTWLHISAKQHLKSFDGGDSIPITALHTGMSFRYGNATLDILLAPENIYYDAIPKNFNESCSVVRVKSKKGSALFLADIAIEGCNYMLDLYDEALKSDMVQVSHHGVEDAPISIYKKIRASVLFWPCDKALYQSSRNESVKKELSSLPSTKFEYFHYQGSKTVEFDSLNK